MAMTLFISFFLLLLLHFVHGSSAPPRKVTVNKLSFIEEFNALDTSKPLQLVYLASTERKTDVKAQNEKPFRLSASISRGWSGLRLKGSSLSNIIRRTFLPAGYPASVPPEWASYQRWNLLQDMCSYLRGIMGTRAILEGMGVGRADVTPLSATIAWIVRDGAAMLGSLLFTSLSSADFGQNVKSWRLFADSINNVGITLDMLAPLFPSRFMLIVCVASVCKALCGVAAGAAGGAIFEHFSLEGNIADVMAKHSAQHTLISLLGLSVSVKFAKLFSAISPRLMWVLYAALTSIHLGSNLMAMRVLSLRSLNIERSKMLITSFLSLYPYKNFSYNITSVLQLHTAQESLSLTSIARREPILSPILSALYREREDVVLWSSPLGLLRQDLCSIEELERAVGTYKVESYILVDSKKSQRKIYAVIKKSSLGLDQLKALFEGHLINKLRSDAVDAITSELVLKREEVTVYFNFFMDVLRLHGWSCDRIMLRPGSARVFEFY